MWVGYLEPSALIELIFTFLFFFIGIRKSTKYEKHGRVANILFTLHKEHTRWRHHLHECNATQVWARNKVGELSWSSNRSNNVGLHFTTKIIEAKIFFYSGAKLLVEGRAIGRYIIIVVDAGNNGAGERIFLCSNVMRKTTIFGICMSIYRSFSHWLYFS